MSRAEQPGRPTASHIKDIADAQAIAALAVKPWKTSRQDIINLDTQADRPVPAHGGVHRRLNRQVKALANSVHVKLKGKRRGHRRHRKAKPRANGRWWMPATWWCM